MKNNSGFTLIETSILIIMISLILVPLFGYMTQIRLQEKAIAEEAEMDTILAAIAKFLKENNRYPCPASLNAAKGTAAYGNESCGIGGPGISSRGGLPTQQLGLSQDYVTNNYDWKYIYAVQADQAVTGTYDSTERDLVINFEGGGSTTSAFVVINPGADGKGSRNANGSAGPACGGSAAKDAENCDNDITSFDGFNSKLNNINDADYFDDTVSYAVAREESTHWKTRDSTSGNLDISIRKPGGVSIGIDGTTGAPADPGANKLLVKGGNIRINRENSNGGSLMVDNTIDSEDNVQSSEGNMDVDVEVRSPIYYYD